jgi:hypothetical protein
LVVSLYCHFLVVHINVGCLLLYGWVWGMSSDVAYLAEGQVDGTGPDAGSGVEGYAPDCECG